MEKPKFLTAEEAYQETIKNRATIEECMQNIINQTINGNSFACFFKEIDQSAIDKLLDAGYQLGTFTDPMGQKFFKITWKQ